MITESVDSAVGTKVLFQLRVLRDLMSLRKSDKSRVPSVNSKLLAICFCSSPYDLYFSRKIMFPEKGTFLPKDKTLELAIKFRMFFLYNSKLNFETECNSILCSAASLDSIKYIVMGVLVFTVCLNISSYSVLLIFAFRRHFHHHRGHWRERGKGDISSHDNLNCIFLKQNNTFCCKYQKQPFDF